MDNKNFKLALFASLSVLSLSACTEFDPGSSILDTRVLGARVEVAGEPERATPEPGERINLTWVMASPGKAPVLRWAFVVCVGDPNAPGETCRVPLTTGEGTGLTPTLQVDVPAAGALGTADALFVLGVICDGGTPGLSGSATPVCEGKDSSGTSVKLELSIARDGQQNENPRVDEVRIRIDGKGLADQASDVAEGQCANDDSLLQLRADGKEHDLTLELGGKVRERYRDAEGRSNALEALQISHFVTLGELERQYSFIESGDPDENPKVTLTWTAPKAKDVKTGELVRFLTVLRDMRGGLAVIEQAACVIR